MKTENIDKIKTLLRNSAAISGFFELFRSKYMTDTRCDKKGARFNDDQRFASFKVALSFDNWAGYYGDSGCHTILHVDDAVVGPYFVKAANIHREELFATAAKLMRDDADKLKAEAAAEIESLQKMMTELEPAA